MIAATVTGNLGQDCRVGTAGDTPVVNVSVASCRYEKGAEQTDWVDVAFFGVRAEKIAQFLKKGSRIAARGTLYVREYTHNNEKRSALTMRADDIELLGSNEKSDARPPTGARAPSPGTHHADDIPF